MVNDFIQKMRADFPGGQFEKAQFHERIGQLDLAEKAYLKSLKYDNYFNIARINLAHLYHSKGDINGAVQMFKTVIDQEPEYGMAYYSLGLLLAEANHLDQAAFYLKQAAEREVNIRSFYNLGIVYQQMGKIQEAEETYLAGLSLEPGHDDLLYALTVLYYQQRKPLEAKLHLRKLLEKYPDQPRFRQMWEEIEKMTD